MSAKLLLGFLLLVLAANAAASFGTPPNVSEIMREQRAIRERTEDSMGAYSRLNPDAMARLTRAQDRVFQLLGGADTVDHLNKDQKVELFNALEEVKAVLKDNEHDRLVCKRERKVGTSIRQTRCATVAQRKELEEGGKDWLRPRMCGEGFAPSTDCGGNLREYFVPSPLRDVK